MEHGIGMVNGLGTIDSDYRGEIAALLVNHGKKPFTVDPGMRICQIVFTEVLRAVLTPSPNLNQSPRPDKGFGSTGV